MPKDTRIKDYVTGRDVRATKEEVEAVQVFARALVNDYGYDKAQIQTHPQWRVKVRPSDTRKSYPVDIAVFSDENHTDDSLLLVVECKKKTRHDGLGQLKDYLRFSSARAGVWFNGDERVFIAKHETAGQVKFHEIPNIPRKGERLEDIGKHRRRDLSAPHNLKVVFRAIRNYLAGNAVGATRDEALAEQIINLIFCKIYDERFTAPGDILEFRAGIGESATEVAQRIRALFAKVREKYKEVIDLKDEISLDDRSVVYIVGELQNFCITEAERDVVADAFETFIGRALKGGQGQFFTPRNVVRLMVNIVNPSEEETVIDPACGSGGFLVETLKHIWGKIDDKGKHLKWSAQAITEEKTAAAISRIRGLEKDGFLSKVAKAYMAIIGDGKGGIFCEDSLDDPQRWGSATRQQIGLGQFGCVLTNPPFGRDIQINGESKLSQYTLARKWARDKNTGDVAPTDELRTEVRPEMAFIERCLQFLRDGGVMGIILPETFFHAQSSEYVLSFMERHNIQWVVDLPHNTFRPHNNAKCIFVVLQKNKPQDSKINMAVAEEMGHDHQGRPLYRWDARAQEIDRAHVWDDIPVILEETRKERRKKHVFQVPADTPKQKRLYVPRYYWQTREREVEKIAKERGLILKPVSEFLDAGILRSFDGDGSPRADYKGRGDIPYIRVKDIVNWEIYKDPTAAVPERVYHEMTKDKPAENFVRQRDVVYVRRGSYRIGSVAMVSPHDSNILMTKEILVLRAEKQDEEFGLNPYYLLYLLSHRLVKMQAFNRILIETTLPNIADRWRDLRLPLFENHAEAEKVSNEVRMVINSKWNAVSRILKLREKYGDLTT